MTRKHRYRQGAIPGVPEAQPRDYSPEGEPQPDAIQGALPLDGAVLGPLFAQPQQGGASGPGKGEAAP